MNADDLTPSAWATLTAETEPATYGALIDQLAERLDLSNAAATDAIDQALDAGTIVEVDGSGAYPEVIVPDQPQEATTEASDDQETAEEPEGEPIDTRVSAAFADAIDWFHAQLDRRIADHLDSGEHPDRATTARTYFEDVRGWDSATIADKQLGYAPADGSGLLNHLMGQGYARDAILGTGLFTENLSPLWQGRYVFPYFDAEGQPVYAISRVTGGDGGGAQGYDGHPADGMSGKYAKPAHTKDYAHVEEPIYGTATIEAGQPVLITEGIADAITAHEAGYACLSPVTTQFKHDDRENLLAVLDEYDIPSVYVIQDAERATSEVDEHGQLTVAQLAPGLKGALTTADYLETHADEMTVALAELPRPGLAKVDLDDYLQAWSETLAPILASAKPASEYPGYDPKDAAITAARTDDDEYTPSGSDGNRSALFDFDIRDVTGLSWDSRGKNPLGHHGSEGGSKNYFVLIERDSVAYDHKYKVAYNALTYLLCEAGERRAADPNGRLDDEELLAAWLHAKQKRLLPEDDPIPHRALVAIALAEDLCDRDEIEDGWKLPRNAYDAAIESVEEIHGVTPGREPLARGTDPAADDHDDEWTVDPTTLDVVLDHERAWRAAKQTTPADLEDGSMETLDLDVTDNGDAWTCPHCDGTVGVVQAVALDRGTIDCCEEPLRDDDYDAAYWHARTAYGAPLPEFVSTETATDNWALVQGAVSQLSHWHLSGMDSTVTGDGGADDDVVAEIDPCWADSASGQRIVAFRSGQFYCREHECGVDPLRFVALEHGIISDCDDSLEGDAFTTAYHIAREQYGASLPEWETGAPDHTPVLPPADDLLGELGTDTDTLDEAREEVTALFRSCARDRTASVLTTLPALGKTTAGVILADEYPLLYLGPRRELMAEVEQKADEWDRSCQHLPIFAAEPPTEGAIAEALDLVREEDKQLLRARKDLAERIDTPITDEEDDEDNEEEREIRDPETAYPTAESAHADGYESLSAARRQVEAQNRQIDRAREQRRAAEDDDIDLDRASCPCGNGTHGEAWQLVVHVARALGHTPQEIHTRDEELFGDTLPCHADGECEYALGWERATDPDDPNDILIGHYGHGYVDGARVHRERDADDHVSVTNRTIAIDEFPGDTYDQTFDEEFVDHAAWAAGALCPAVDDRQALFEQDLGDDDTLRAWIDGTATDDVAAFETVDARLDCMTDLREALEAAEHRREALEATDYEGAEAEGAQALIGGLDTVLALGPDWDGAALDTAYTTLRETVTDVGDEHLGLLRDCSDIEEDILPVLSQAAASVEPDDRLGATTAPERCGGDLTDLVATAVTAFCEEREGAQGLIHAARMALAGGEEGCRELAIHADDGYAHPMAYLLLDGLIDDTEATDGAPTAPDAEAIIATEDFDFDDDGDGESGTNLARTCHGRQTILTDRNHHGALIRDPPAFQGGSESVPNPVIGLDATGRESLWELAIGCSVETADIHETAREKRAFLRDVLNLQVVQTSPHIQSYSGSPDSTNFDGPVALVNRIAEEYSESLLRRDTLSATTKPGVITTKKAEGAIADRVRSDVGALEHYGDITGSNALGDHNLGAVLGSRHYGDAPVEKWAALAGESVEREGKGARLDYGCSIGNAFLKHMREDETLQAILRFGRDEEGAVVFAHTSALADSLPVVGEGQVVKTFTENGRDITNVARQYRDEEFAISDLVDEVECSRETIRRTLNEFAELGYLTKHETKNGVANGFQSLEEPGAGEVELPEIEDPFDPDGPPGGGDEDPHRSPVIRYYTWSVEVDMDDLPSSPRRESTRATLPAPARIAAGPPSE